MPFIVQSAHPILGGAVCAGRKERQHTRRGAFVAPRNLMEGRLAILRGGEEVDKAQAMREHETRAKHSTGGHV